MINYSLHTVIMISGWQVQDRLWIKWLWKQHIEYVLILKNDKDIESSRKNQFKYKYIYTLFLSLQEEEGTDNHNTGSDNQISLHSFTSSLFLQCLGSSSQSAGVILQGVGLFHQNIELFSSFHKSFDVLFHNTKSSLGISSNSGHLGVQSIFIIILHLFTNDIGEFVVQRERNSSSSSISGEFTAETVLDFTQINLSSLLGILLFS